MQTQPMPSRNAFQRQDEHPSLRSFIADRWEGTNPDPAQSTSAISLRIASAASAGSDAWVIGRPTTR